MSKAVLSIVAEAMAALGIEYGFGEYSGNPIVYPYYVGEYAETEPLDEDGLQESTFMLTGFARESASPGGAWLALENTKELIEGQFHRITGKTVITDDGSAVAVFYAGAQPIPTGEDDLKRIQINLHTKEWKVN